MKRFGRYAFLGGAACTCAAVALAETSTIAEAQFGGITCSVFSRHPCLPTVCSPLRHGPCQPQYPFPLGENLQLTIQTVPPKDEAAKYLRPDHDLDSIGDLFAELRSCWSPPPPDTAHQGMQMSVRFSFRRSGEIIGVPRMTYATAGVSPEIRQTYLKAIDDSLNACVPLKFTGGLGGALAGRPIAIRYVDNRELRKLSN